MEELIKSIQKMLEPYRNIKMVQPIAIKSIEKTLNEFQQSFINLNKVYDSIPELNNPILKHIDTFREIGILLKEYREQLPEKLLKSAEHGWFFELYEDLTLCSNFYKLIEVEKFEEADNIMNKYYDNNIKRIFTSLEQRHPNRKIILKQAFNSYKENQHYIFIPCILTQIDGICFDFTKRKFFIKEKGNNYLPQITSELEKSTNTFLNLYLSPLQNQTPIMVREQDLTKFPCKLNRHEILHGISTEFGTKTNSLKVISLLKYISDLLKGLDTKTLSTTSVKRK